MDSTRTQLHWTQRLALARHALHVGARTLNFTFFKFVQAHNYVSGRDHVATLSAILNDDADVVVSNLDKFNTVIACVYEDAFKALYDSVKQTARDSSCPRRDRIAIYGVDCTRQKAMAISAADKMLNMAFNCIQSQPESCQDTAAEVFIMGMTFVADAVEVCLTEMDRMEALVDDFIRLEESWSLVQSSTAWSISAMKGVFNLMAIDSKPGEPFGTKHVRSQSIDVYARSMLKRVSSALSNSSQTPSAGSSRRVSIGSTSIQSRRSSIVSVNSVVSPKRTSFPAQESPTHNQYPTNQYSMKSGNTHTMSPIPPTPADGLLNNPFDAPNVNDVAYQRQVSSSSPPDLRSVTVTINANALPSNSNGNTSAREQSHHRGNGRRGSISFATRERPPYPPALLREPSDPSPKTSPQMERPPLVHAPPSLASFSSARSGDSATVYAEDPLLPANSGLRDHQAKISSHGNENPGLLSRISSVLYAAPVIERH